MSWGSWVAASLGMGVLWFVWRVRAVYLQNREPPPVLEGARLSEEVREVVFAERAPEDDPAFQALLDQVAEGQGMEAARTDARSVLLGWHRLRERGIQPAPEAADEVLGVVVESYFVADEGAATHATPITLAVFLDGESLYHHGAQRVPAERDTRTDVLEAGHLLVVAASELEDLPPPGPRSTAVLNNGRVRFTFLTPSGPREVEVNLDRALRDGGHPLHDLAELSLYLVGLKRGFPREKS
ncbi:hypothetical protein LZ198_24725 [Myxococcus sp. K15C18031901]|uniref:hypothetical protein n=1 Tax=Myxococcus dinghuensis TaxID=2906761 RepID=UPI0020A7E0F6|nr:hypothetical protein [Myxococcus dinghuensis]MCP3102077.1 hypothetical protein [Myxococcus dinghuensis]